MKNDNIEEALLKLTGKGLDSQDNEEEILQKLIAKKKNLVEK